ncbi:MAG: DUF402 domain-containing protein [Chloroflexi bacterium]|nr:DUF402 domain-containing protein [Chloroflexota bacterium]
MQVREIKQHLNGTRQVFFCEALHLDPQVAVLRFVVNADYATDPSVARPHRSTLGYFWAGRNYLLYQMFGDNQTLLGYRFDVCTDVQITEDTVRWTDLLLDFWVDPDLSQGQFLDEDELADALQHGLLTPEQQAAVAQAREQLATGFRDIIREAQDLRSRFVQRVS